MRFGHLVFIFFISSFLGSCKAIAEPAVGSVINVSQFNIKTTNANNTDGFKKLSAHLENKSNIKVVFDPGTYIVGEQVLAANGTQLLGKNILVIKNANNIEIVGNQTTIRYVSSLKYGSFLPHGVEKKGAINRNRKFTASIGNCIDIQGSSRVTVDGLNLQGNAENFDKGEEFGDKGIQLRHVGININESSFVLLKNCVITHFGLDGIYINNAVPQMENTPSQNIEINNCKSTYNGRQALSWTSGSGLKLINSEFNYTGKGGVRSAPASGFDIEPHGGQTCANAMVTNCKFIGNANSGFVSDGNGKRNIFNIAFSNCEFVADNSSAMFPRNGSIKFTNCKITGPIVGLTGRIGHPTTFTNCYITDSSYNSNTNRYFPYLVNPDNSMYYGFYGCTFSVFKYIPLYIASSAKTLAEKPIVENNNFIFNYSSSPPKQWIAVLKNCILDNNKFIDATAKKMPLDVFINTSTAPGNENIIRGSNEIISNKNIRWNKMNGPKNISPTK